MVRRLTGFATLASRRSGLPSGTAVRCQLLGPLWKRLTKDLTELVDVLGINEFGVGVALLVVSLIEAGGCFGFEFICHGDREKNGRRTDPRLLFWYVRFLRRVSGYVGVLKVIYEVCMTIVRVSC